jgi:hypothetical protein
MPTEMSPLPLCLSEFQGGGEGPGAQS